MKKNLKKVSALLVAALVCTGLSMSFGSCKKDKDPDPTPGGDKLDPSTVATANLIAYFPFDGSVTEKVTNNTGSVTNATFVAGRRGQAYQGGNNAYGSYNLPTATINKFTNAKSYTIAMWVKSPQLVAGAGPGTMPWIQLNGGDANMGSIYVGLQDRNTTENPDANLCIKNFLYSDRMPWKGQEWWGLEEPDFPKDKWFHYAIEYNADSSAYRIFSNGKYLTNQVRYGDAVPGDGSPQPLLGDLKFINMTKLYFGVFEKNALGTASESWMLGFFKGNLDEVRIYDKALTDDEIKNLYAAEVDQLNEQ